VAVAASVLTDVQRETLAALCDTFVPSVQAETGDPLERDFLARAASDMEIPVHIEQTFADTLMPEEIQAFAELLDALPPRTSRAARRWSMASATRIRRPSSASIRSRP
jgi:hypothetical protein